MGKKNIRSTGYKAQVIYLGKYFITMNHETRTAELKKSLAGLEEGPPVSDMKVLRHMREKLSGLRDEGYRCYDRT